MNSGRGVCGDLAIFDPSIGVPTILTPADRPRGPSASDESLSSARMFKADEIKALVNKRLSAAAEEIFSIFVQTIKEYEEIVVRSQQELERQRRMGWRGIELLIKINLHQRVNSFSWSIKRDASILKQSQWCSGDAAS